MKKQALSIAMGLVSLVSFGQRAPAQTPPTLLGSEFSAREFSYQNRDVIIKDAQISFLSAGLENTPPGYQGVRVVFVSDGDWTGRVYMNKMMADRLRSPRDGKPVQGTMTFRGNDRMGYVISKFRPLRK